MSDAELLSRYNYDAFDPEKFEPWMRFDHSPPVGEKAPSFPLWRLEDGDWTERRRRDRQRLAPFRVERLDYRHQDRERFYEGLERNGPKAVDEFREVFWGPDDEA
ncbi:MAG: hypothetical protein V3T72_03780 [Thermoanaerobaculia bacterium]